MKYCVVDLEMNNPTEDKKIIQIGACIVDTTSGQILSKFDKFVNPQEELTPFIIGLTGITQKDVNGAETIEFALSDFWKWIQDNTCKNMAAWGSDNWVLTEESKKQHTELEKCEEYK